MRAYPHFQAFGLLFAVVACGPTLESMERTPPPRCPFPSTRARSGEVIVKVLVGPGGKPLRVRVVSEEPRHEGFGQAAVSCVKQLEYEPMQDGSGQPLTYWTHEFPFRFEKR